MQRQLIALGLTAVGKRHVDLPVFLVEINKAEGNLERIIDLKR